MYTIPNFPDIYVVKINLDDKIVKQQGQVAAIQSACLLHKTSDDHEAVYVGRVGAISKLGNPISFSTTSMETRNFSSIVL